MQESFDFEISVCPFSVHTRAEEAGSALTNLAVPLCFPEGVTYTPLTMGLAFSAMTSLCRRRIVPIMLCVVSLCLVSIEAQDRLRSMPGYEQSQKMQSALQGGAPLLSGCITPSWTPDAHSFTYTRAGKTYRFE